jgi:hypothetical protein
MHNGILGNLENNITIITIAVLMQIIEGSEIVTDLIPFRGRKKRMGVRKEMIILTFLRLLQRGVGFGGFLEFCETEFESVGKVVSLCFN